MKKRLWLGLFQEYSAWLAYNSRTANS